MKTRKKLFLISSIVLCPIIISSTLFFGFNQKYISSKQKENTSTQTKAVNPISYKLGDLVDSYGGGFNINEVKSIVIAMPDADKSSTPDLNKKFVSIDFFESNVQVSNTYGTNKDLWNSEILLDEMGSEPDYVKPDIEFQENNFMRISEYNGSSPLSGANVKKWDATATSPSSISANLSLNDSNAWLFQFRIKANSKTSQKARVYLNVVGTDSKEKWIMPNANNLINFGAYTINQLSVVEMFFVKHNNKVMSFVPKKGMLTNIGSWNVPTDDSNQIWNQYRSLPINIAYEKLQQNPNDVKEIVTWNPTMVLPSMSNFPVTLNPNFQESRLEFNYGNNNDFKYVFYVSQKANYHIYPYKFELDGPAVPGEYINVKQAFENYQNGKSVITGFSKGTYILPTEWDFDKNRYPSQVPESEIKEKVLNHLGNTPNGLTVDDIVFNPVDSNPNPLYNNATGELQFTITLKKALGNDGTEQANQLIKPTQTITGFKKIAPTKALVNVLDIGLNDQLASSVTVDQLKPFVIQNKDRIFNTLATNLGGSELTVDDFDLSITKTQNTPEDPYTTGFATTHIVLRKNFLREPDATISQPGDKYEFDLTFTGFKTVKATIFKNPVNINRKDLLASSQTLDDIRKIISGNVDLFFKNLPDEFDATSNNSLLINSIVESSNLGKPDVDNGNSGFVKVNITVVDYFDETGNISKNKTYDLVITGFKLTGSTSIQDNVKLNGYADQLVTDVIPNEEAFKLIIKNNEKLFFGKSFLPDGYFDSMEVSIITKTNTNKDYQLVATISLNKYFDQNGDLMEVGKNTSTPLSQQVNISGFKVINPTMIKAGKYDINTQYENQLPSAISDDEIKNIILNDKTSLKNGPIITGDKPGSFGVQNLILENIQKNNLSGEITFDLNINLRYENNEIGNIVNDPFPNYERIILANFQTSTPTGIVAANPITINDNYKLLQKTNVALIESIINNNLAPDAAIQNPEEILTELKKFLWTEVFTGYKEKPFNESQIKITNVISRDNLEGSIELEFSLTKYMNEEGFIVNDDLPTTKKIIGFKKVTPTSVNKEGSPFLVPQDKYGAYKVDEIVEAGLLPEVIYDYDFNNGTDPVDKIIIGDIPPNFNYNTNLIISNVRPDSLTSTITLDLTFNLYFDAVNGNVTNGNPPPPVTIVLRGFEKLPITSINGVAITPRNIYPTTTNQNYSPVNVNINPSSSVSGFSAKEYISTLNGFTSNTIELGQIYLDNMFSYINDFYFYNKEKSPMVIMNPKSNWEIKVDSIAIKQVNQYDGSLLLTARVRGYYFYQSSEPVKIGTANQDYAYMDIHLTGFEVPNTYQEYKNSFIIIGPIAATASVVFIFIALTIMFIIKKKKRSIATEIGIDSYESSSF